eukprot:scaffold3202_cov117-Isochrysis_galbana.AAC.4
MSAMIPALDGYALGQQPREHGKGRCQAGRVEDCMGWLPRSAFDGSEQSLGAFTRRATNPAVHVPPFDTSEGRAQAKWRRHIVHRREGLGSLQSISVDGRRGRAGRRHRVAAAQHPHPWREKLCRPPSETPEGPAQAVRAHNCRPADSQKR